MANVLCVLYDDPVDGFPPDYVRDQIPTIERYHDGQTTPTPEAIGFTPGDLLGCVSGELGLRDFLESGGHRLTVTSDKDDWGSGEIPPGGEFTATFTKAGTFDYHCKLHKDMKGTIIVK